MRKQQKKEMSKTDSNIIIVSSNIYELLTVSSGHGLPHFVLPTTQRGRQYYYFCFIDNVTGVETGQILTQGHTSLRSHKEQPLDWNPVTLISEAELFITT